MRPDRRLVAARLAHMDQTLVAVIRVQQATTVQLAARQLYFAVRTLLAVRERLQYLTVSVTLIFMESQEALAVHLSRGICDVHPVRLLLMPAGVLRVGVFACSGTSDSCVFSPFYCLAIPAVLSRHSNRND